MSQSERAGCSRRANGGCSVDGTQDLVRRISHYGAFGRAAQVPVPRGRFLVTPSPRHIGEGFVWEYPDGVSQTSNAGHCRGSAALTGWTTWASSWPSSTRSRTSMALRPGSHLHRRRLQRAMMAYRMGCELSKRSGGCRIGSRTILDAFHPAKAPAGHRDPRAADLLVGAVHAGKPPGLVRPTTPSARPRDLVSSAACAQVVARGCLSRLVMPSTPRVVRTAGRP